MWCGCCVWLLLFHCSLCCCRARGSLPVCPPVCPSARLPVCLARPSPVGLLYAPAAAPSHRCCCLLLPVCCACPNQYSTLKLVHTRAHSPSLPPLRRLPRHAADGRLVTVPGQVRGRSSSWLLRYGGQTGRCRRKGSCTSYRNQQRHVRVTIFLRTFARIPVLLCADLCGCAGISCIPMNF